MFLLQKKTPNTKNVHLFASVNVHLNTSLEVHLGILSKALDVFSFYFLPFVLPFIFCSQHNEFLTNLCIKVNWDQAFSRAVVWAIHIPYLGPWLPIQALLLSPASCWCATWQAVSGSICESLSPCETPGWSSRFPVTAGLNIGSCRHLEKESVPVPLSACSFLSLSDK